MKLRLIGTEMVFELLVDFTTRKKFLQPLTDSEGDFLPDDQAWLPIEDSDLDSDLYEIFSN